MPGSVMQTSRSPLNSASLWMILLFAFLSGCASVTGKDSAAQILDAQTARRLHQRNWDLKALRVDGRQIVIDVDTKISIGFSPGGKVAGIAAVNRFSANYSLSADGKLSWSGVGIAATRNTGPPELMQKERAFLKALLRANVAILAGRVLLLQSVDTSTVLTFSEAGY